MITCLGLPFTIQAEQTILVVGDSLSSAYGIEPNQGWVTLLARRLEEHHLPYQVVNISTGGDTTSNGVEKLPKALSQYQPKLVIIALGSNDGLRGLPTQLLHKNLMTLINLTHKHQARVLLIGFMLPLNYGPQYRSQFETVYQNLTDKYHLIKVPFLLERIALIPQYMQADGLHPNALAQPIILENVWPYLLRVLGDLKLKSKK